MSGDEKGMLTTSPITIPTISTRRTLLQITTLTMRATTAALQLFNKAHNVDMARYKVQKGPMCQTCVPVPLCRKIFGGKAHRLHVFFVAYDFVYEVFNVMYILFVSYTV